MNQKICDLCKEPMSEIDHVYFVSYGERSAIPLMGKKKNGEICFNCYKKVDSAIQALKK